MADPVNDVSARHARYTQRSAQWLKVRHCIEGQDAVKDQGEIYLPKPSGQERQEYDAYRRRAVFYGVCERTLRGLTGMVFRVAPTVTLPPRLEPWKKTATSDGYSARVLINEVVREVLSVGRYGLLLDYPEDGAPATEAPYIATFFAEDILNWEQEFVRGHKVLTRLVLRDEVSSSESAAEKLRELHLDEAGVYTIRKWVRQDTRGEFVLDGEPIVPLIAGKPLKYIPFVFVNPYDLRPEVEKPPFLDLANMNLSHYCNSADLEHSLFLTAQPTPWVSGAFAQGQAPKTIGPANLWVLPVDGKAGMVEFSGAGIEATRTSMLDKESRMAALGARMISENSMKQETADRARIRGATETSLVVSVVDTVVDAFEQLLDWATSWVGASPESAKIEISKDFVETRLTPQELDALMRAWQAGAISGDTLHTQLQRGEIIDPQRSYEEERELIAEEEPDLVAPDGEEEEEEPEEDPPAPGQPGATPAPPQRIA